MAASPSRLRDAAFAACLALVLATGVVGVLLVNTAMQQQSRVIAAAHQRIAALQQQATMMTTHLQMASTPWQLARRARALHLRPARRVAYLTLSRRGAVRARAG